MTHRPIATRMQVIVRVLLLASPILLVAGVISFLLGLFIYMFAGFISGEVIAWALRLGGLLFGAGLAGLFATLLLNRFEAWRIRRAVNRQLKTRSMS